MQAHVGIILSPCSLSGSTTFFHIIKQKARLLEEKIIEYKTRVLGYSYRAPSVRIAIRLPTDATVYFVCLFPLFTLHVSGSHKPIIRGISSCFYIQPFGSCVGQEITIL